MLASKVLILIGVSLQAWDSTAIIFRQSPLTKPAYCAHEVGCFSPITKKVIPFGVNVYPTGVCKKLACESDGYTAVHSCEKKVVPRGCHLSRERKLHYPHCCAKVICPRIRYDDTYDTYDDDRYPYADQSHGYYDDDDVYVRPRRYRRYTDVDYNGDAGLVYDDERGDDYKKSENKKILYDKKKESSRRAPWNKKGDVSSPTVVPVYSTDDYEDGHIKYYKADNRGDDYKLKDNKKIVYDKKKESSRRAPWNKKGDVSSPTVVPVYSTDDYEGGHVKYYKADNRGDDYKLKDSKKTVYDKKKESSRRAPWNKKGDVSSPAVVSVYSTDDYEGGHVKYYKADNRGDDYKLKDNKKIVYDKKKESSRRAPWNKNKNLNYGETDTAPGYDTYDYEDGTVKYYTPENRGDDYKLEENRKDYYDDQDQSSRRSPWTDSDDEDESVDDPEYNDDDVGFDDGRGDNYKLHEKQGNQSYDHKKVTSRRAPWNDNATV